MDPARGAAARVQREGISFLMLVEDPIHIPVAVEHTAAEHGVEFARPPLDSGAEGVRNALRAELGHQPIVVNLTPDFPGGDDEVLRHGPMKAEGRR